MINQSLINNLPEDNGFLYNHISNPFQTSNYRVIKGPVSGCWEVYKNDNVNMLFNDSIINIDEYAKNIKNLNFSSILFAGLGLGILPFLCQDSTTTIDVVEIDQEIINLTTGIGHLNSNVNIINDDIFNFTPTKTYDVILIDIWSVANLSVINPQVTTLTEKYTSYLNENGLLYFPITEW
jgi:tRNA1(Val) A37 N6-methylase TrmN6